MQDQKLESAKGEMREVIEENKRLKLLLARLSNDYQSLQTNFTDILIQQDRQEESTKATCQTSIVHEESEFISLSLGMSCTNQPSRDEKKNSNRAEKRKLDDEDLHKGLALGLDIKFDPSTTEAEVTNNHSQQRRFGNEEEKREESSEIWAHSKVMNTMKAEDKSETSQHSQLKKTRVSIRARCETQTMNDGCQWRKYGQKIAKGNPFPRGYYRCTVSPSCPVRKQHRNQGGNVINTGKQPFHQGHLHQPIYMSNHTISQQQSVPDSIVAATKAITTNQKFQSALATALTTYVGNGTRAKENDVPESAALDLKLSSGDVSFTSSQNGIGFASSRY
ncbi:unnamed protein product [Lupinus luteus]|uniref:WRKY domain-containing protein n=1 Tax=Lupinus luteus TaxID=3873 RepID=A0AAV1X9I8_LUPLU